MNPATLAKAIKEAKRFLKAAELAYSTECEKGKTYSWGGKNSAAAKRSSMDLTRALADLRQGR